MAKRGTKFSTEAQSQCPFRFKIEEVIFDRRVGTAWIEGEDSE